MLRSLRARLTISFLLVAVASVGVIGVLFKNVAALQFYVYLERSPSRIVDLLFPRPYLDVRALVGIAEEQYLAALRQSLLQASVGVALLAGLVGFFLAHRLSKPLNELTRAATEFAASRPGQLAAIAPAPRKGEGEVEKLSRAFHAMALSLDQHEQQRRQFLADVAHELRTPLTIIQGRLEAILDGVIEPTPEEVAALHSQALLMGRLVHDLEMLALAQAKALTLHMEEVDPVTLASEALQAHVILAEREQLDLKLDVPDDVPTVHADPDRLKQVLSNLITNAIRHSHAQGTVTLRVEAAPRREGTRADIAYGVNDGSDLDELGVAFSVIDHGVGIPVEALPTVFEPFSRVDPSRTRKSGGSGLGLAIVRYLVEAHGGAVWVMSREGIGTRITAWLPAQAKTV
ncbi:MAG: HAMP domain-containing protein [Firmicutes bacterium]|nr:HAMP domain-containing protein [Bacillota bacterium]